MSTEQRLELIKQVGEEILTENELTDLLDSNKQPLCYDGFEPSGNIHIAQGIFRAINTNKMTKAGCKFRFLVADWFALMNNKLGGDLDKIKLVGQYFIEVWKAVGMDLSNVDFVWSSDLIKDDSYWFKVIQISRNTTIKRMLRCSQIMGRTQEQSQYCAQIFYPAMQCADMFHMGVDIAQLGMDQRKVNVLAREIAPKLNYRKPVAVHHHMLAGLNKPPEGKTGVELAIAKKMSKSKPDTAIFMSDTEKDIKRKISKAYCPEGVVESNPILEYTKYLIFEKFDKFKIERPAKFGGDLEFKSYTELEIEFKNKQIHPMDLKNAVSIYINKMIEPVRIHFEKNQKAKELMEQVMELRK